MYIVEVVPLTKLVLSSPQVLTYFSPQDIKRGALLFVSLRGRKVEAVCLTSSSVEERKGEIKEKRYKLTQIEEMLTNQPLLTEKQIELAFWVHRYYLAPLGQCLRMFLPHSYLNRRKPFEVSPLEPEEGSNPARSLLLWSEQRTKYYREKVMKKDHSQVLVLVPELGDISRIRTKLNTKAESVAYHSQLGTRSERENWTKVRNGEASLIIGTRSSVFLPFKNLSHIIVDKEEDEGYKSWDQHPRYHTREVSQTLSALHRADLILGTSLPSLDSFYKAGEGKIKMKKEGMREREVGIKVVDMKEEIKKKNFSPISQELRSSLKNTLEKNEKAILFINRRGHSTSVFCRDCGFVVRCPNCDSSLVYHHEYGNRKEVMVCHHCGFKKNPPSACPRCESWRIKYSGKGTQKVKKVLKEILEKDAKIAIIDSDKTPEEEDQRKVIQSFKENGVNLLVGTSLLLKSGLEHLLPQVDLSSVILADSLLSFPDYQSTEKAFRTILKLKKITRKLIIQTYSSELEIWDYLKDKPEKFLKKELEKRKALSYPPYSEIIKLSFTDEDEEKVLERSKKFKEFLEKVIKKSDLSSDLILLGPAPSLVPRREGSYSYHLILKVKDKRKQVKKFLKDNLPRNWEVDVNPHSLL